MGILKHLHTFQHYASCLGPWQTLRLQAARRASAPTLSLTLPGIKSPVECRPTASDRMALSQIFILHECDVALSYRPRLIIDGGANVGYTSVFFANKYPEAQIIAVEPEAENFRMARQNCRPYPNIKLVQGGIWTSDSPLKIENDGADSWAFTVKEVEKATPDTIQGYTLKSLIAMSDFKQVDLLKLDIEGAEEFLFSAPDTGWLADTRTIIVEIHSKRAEQAIEETLRRHSFVRTQIGEKVIYSNTAL